MKLHQFHSSLCGAGVRTQQHSPSRRAHLACLPCAHLRPGSAPLLALTLRPPQKSLDRLRRGPRSWRRHCPLCSKWSVLESSQNLVPVVTPLLIPVSSRAQRLLRTTFTSTGLLNPQKLPAALPQPRDVTDVQQLTKRGKQERQRCSPFPKATPQNSKRNDEKQRKESDERKRVLFKPETH